MKKINSGVLSKWTWGFTVILIIAVALIYLALN
jgi:hypothetical protein